MVELEQAAGRTGGQDLALGLQVEHGGQQTAGIDGDAQPAIVQHGGFLLLVELDLLRWDSVRSHCQGCDAVDGGRGGIE
ncbi:MAG: hypothetical protein Q605_AUC00816G0003, partial [Actinomyces urogenitalis DORA_12]